MEKLQIYRCSLCKNIVELEFVGGGPLSCCGKPMELQKPGTTDGAAEKHVPVVERQASGYLVKIGSQPHPMLPEHYIEWIDLITEDKVYRKFLKPGEKAEAFFGNIKDEHFLVREYCNLHGLWENKK